MVNLIINCLKSRNELRELLDNALYWFKQNKYNEIDSILGTSKDDDDLDENYLVLELELENSLNSLNSEILKTRIFSKDDSLMNEFLIFLIKDYKPLGDMDDLFSNSTMGSEHVSLCFGKTFYEAFDCIEYEFIMPDLNNSNPVYYQLFLAQDSRLYIYGFLDNRQQIYGSLGRYNPM